MMQPRHCSTNTKPLQDTISCQKAPLRTSYACLDRLTRTSDAPSLGRPSKRATVALLMCDILKPKLRLVLTLKAADNLKLRLRSSSGRATFTAVPVAVVH